MKPEFLDKKVSLLRDQDLFACIEETIYNALKMLTLQAKQEHSKLVFDGILPIIRHRFNDFTVSQIDSAIKSGSYGEFGDYTKLNPKTILDWFSKKRVEISISNDRNSKDDRRHKEDGIIPCKHGGDAILLGLLYHERGIKDSAGNEISFKQRLQIIESGKKCPFTGGNVAIMVANYNPTDLFKME